MSAQYEVVCAVCKELKSPVLENPPKDGWTCGWCAQAEWRRTHRRQWTITAKRNKRRKKMKPVPAREVNLKPRRPKPG